MVADDVAKLLLAARDGDLASLSSEKVTDSLQDDQGATCLHYAARGGCLPAVEFLVHTKGLNPRKCSNVGATPLHDAAATGSLTVLKWLLNNTDNTVDDQDGTGATVAHLSARYGHAQLLEWLMDEADCDILKKSASGALPLHFSAEGGHLECVKVLVAENPRSINMQMSNGSTPAYLACQMGHLAVAEFLATKNGTPKIHTFDGMSTLHAAAQTGQLHMVKWLVKDQGLNSNERDFDGATPLHYAASRGHSEVVVWLLKEGGARIILDNLGGSPLHSAAEFGQNKVVLSLLQNGCSRDITDNEGLTAEELADKCGQTTTVAILRGEITTLPDSEPATPVKASPQQPQSKPPPAQPSPRTAPAAPSSSSHTTQVYAVRGQGTPSSPHRVFEAKQASYDRPVSAISAASSASSFGYFSPNCGGKTEVVSVDVYNSPDKTQKVYSCNSQETGEQEFCKFTGEPLSQLTPQEEAPGISFTARQSSASSASVSSGASSAASTLSSTSPRSNISTDSDHRVTRITYTPERKPAPSASRAGATQPNLSSQPTTLPTSRKMDGGDTSLSPKMNGQATGMNGTVTGSGSNSSLGTQGNAKSVIKISSKNVTIISTGKNSGIASKVTTTPLRRSDDDLPAMGAVSQRKKDNEFISALSQKLQVNGPSNVVKPAPVPLASRGSNTSLTEKGPDSETKPSNFAAVLQEKLSVGNLGTRPSSQALTNNSHTAHKRQQGPSEATLPPPAPPVLVNGHADDGLTVETNGVSGSSSGQVTPVVIPPPPPPPAPSDSFSNIRASNGFKADASYEGTRPKSLSTQSSTPAIGSIPSSPRGNGGTPEQQKQDLLAALHAVVTSGSPSASLRKTRGPHAIGIKEVFASKKTSGDSSPTMDKQAGPAVLPPVDEFDWKNFLDKIPPIDASGNQVPDWKRQMMAKGAAQKAHAEYLEKKKVEDYEARFVNMPAWKRALVEKKDLGGK